MINEIIPTEISNWDDEILLLKDKVAKAKSQDDVTIFYGSSTFRLWETMERDFAPLNVLNLGFGGCTYADCLHYFDELFDGIAPSTIVLYGGDNDLANGQNIESIVQNLESLLAKIRLRYPEAKVGVVSVKVSPVRLYLMDKIIALNTMIKSLVDDYDARYIDILENLTDDSNVPNSDYFVEDELHLNPEGYRIWQKQISDFLNK